MSNQDQSESKTQLKTARGGSGRLTGEQVLRRLFLLIALVITGLGLGRFSFGNVALERLHNALIVGLLIALPIIIFRGPKRRIRTLLLWLLIPLVPLLGLVAFGVLFNFNEYPPYTVRLVYVPEAGVSVSQIQYYDITYYDICKTGMTLQLERPIFAGRLKETKILLDVLPAENGSFAIIEQGRKVRFTSPSLAGRKEIVRTFDLDWNAPANKHPEYIKLKSDEH